MTGGRVPDERAIGLPGYPGGSDKVGNSASDQFQLGIFGEALLLFASAAQHDLLGSEHWRAVETAVSAIRVNRETPDAGIWELENRHWAHSRLICAAGLRAIGMFASAREAAEWNAMADAIVAEVAGDSVHLEGRWQRHPDDGGIDAALLLPALRGAVPPDDPRTTATLDAVWRDLTRDGYVYRFSQDARELGDAEGAFLLCGFQLSMALQQQGYTAEAIHVFERSRTACGSPGLLSEEYDVRQRQLRGNIPQAFVHAELLEASKRLGPSTLNL